MTIVETVERKGALRATIFYVLAGLLLVALMVSFGARETGPLQAVWVALATAATMHHAPLLQWLKPRNPVARLLEDESVREHRRMATTTGFWAAVGASVLLLALTENAVVLSAYDAVRVVLTAALVAGLTSFATLEQRAARG
ncbi:MAG: hypothetical protein ACTHMG_00250 [Sphingomonas sp.]